MVYAPATQTSLGHGKGLAPRTQHVGCRHPHIRIANVAMAAGAGWLRANPHIANDVNTWRVGWHNKHGHALVGWGIWVSHRHGDEKVRIAGIG